MDIVEYSLEMVNRRSILVEKQRFIYKEETLTNKNDIAMMMNEIFRMKYLAEEHLYAIAMDTKCHIIGVSLLSKGTVNYSVVTPGIIFTRMLILGAPGFVIVHNHPSGDVIPSDEDVRTTQRIRDGASIMGIDFLDHIIIGDNGTYSFKEQKICI